MRIGIYTPYLDTLTGGERYMLTIAECLKKNNDVVIFWDEKDILTRAEKKLNLDLTDIQVVPNIFTPGVSTLSRLKKTRDYDLLIILSDGSIPSVLSKKLILHFQNPVEWVRKSVQNRLKMMRVSEIICNSEFTKKYIDKKFRIKSRVLYPPIDVNSLPKNGKKENIILTVGRFAMFDNGTTYKKQEILIDVFKKMVDGGLRDWKLVVVTSYFPRDEKFIKEMEQDVKGYPIEILKNLPSSKLSELYGSAKIYWHGTGFGEDIEKNPDRAEHFGMTTVEAIAAGLIPVVYDAGGQKEIVKKGIGYVFETREELIERTHMVMDNYQKLSKKDGRGLMQQYSKDKFCDQLRDIIKEL